MNILYWSATGLLVLGLALIMCDIVYGASRRLSVARAGAVVSTMGALALTVYYCHEGPVFLAAFFGAIFGGDAVALIWGMADSRKRVVTK